MSGSRPRADTKTVNSRIRLLDEQIEHINAAAKDIAEKAKAVFATKDMFAGIQLQLDIIIMKAAENDTTTQNELLKNLREFIDSENTFSTQQKDFLQYYVNVFEALAIAKFHYHKAKNGPDGYEAYIKETTVANKKISELSEKVNDLPRLEANVASDRTVYTAANQATKDELVYVETIFDGYIEIENNIAYKLKRAKDNLSGLREEFEKLVLPAAMPDDGATDDEIIAYNEIVNDKIAALDKLKQQLDDITNNLARAQDLLAEYDASYTQLSDSTNEYNSYIDEYTKDKDAIVGRLNRIYTSVQLQLSNLNNAVERVRGLDNENMDKTGRLCNAMKNQHLVNNRLLTTEQQTQNTQITALNDSLRSHVGVNGMLLREHTEAHAMLKTAMSVETSRANLNAITTIGHTKALPERETFRDFEDDAKAINDLGIVQLATEVNNKRAALVSSKVLIPSRAPVNAPQKEKSFAERHPILTGIGIGLGFGLLLGGIAAACVFIPPVGALALAGLGAIGVTAPTVGIAAAISIAAGATIGVLGGLVGGIATSASKIELDVIKKPPQSQIRRDDNDDDNDIDHDDKVVPPARTRRTAHRSDTVPVDLPSNQSLAAESSPASRPRAGSASKPAQQEQAHVTLKKQDIITLIGWVKHHTNYDSDEKKRLTALLKHIYGLIIAKNEKPAFSNLFGLFSKEAESHSFPKVFANDIVKLKAAYDEAEKAKRNQPRQPAQ